MQTMHYLISNWTRKIILKVITYLLKVYSEPVVLLHTLIQMLISTLQSRCHYHHFTQAETEIHTVNLLRVTRTQIKFRCKGEKKGTLDS